jgi:hypothetical protein
VQARPLIRTLYLYLFAFVGLILVAIGGVRLIDMALRALIFTEAEAQERLFNRQPPYPPVRFRGGAVADTAVLTLEEREQVRAWLQEYENWRRQAELVDPVTARRHRDAASSLAMILVGLPLYLYHWRLIRREAGSPAPPGTAEG